MAATTVNVQMQQRRDTASGWTSANPVLLSGELGFETDTKKAKLGDGSTAWNSLSYLPGFAVSAYPLDTADIADDAVTAAKLEHTSVTAGSYTAADITVDAQGRLTAASNGTVTLADGSVTYAKIQDVSATDKLLGRSSSGAGDVEEITCTAAGRALLDDADASAQRTTLGLAIGVNVQAFDADTAKTDTTQTFSAAQTFTAQSVHNGGLTVDGPYEQAAEAVAALDIDLSTGNYFTKTINANSTFTFSNPPASGTVGSFTLELTHTSGTVSWPSTVKFPGNNAPQLTTGKTHLFVFITDDGGTRYRGAFLADYDN